MPKKSVALTQPLKKTRQTKGTEVLANRWTAKTQKVVTAKMRECAEGILKSADNAEDFLKRAGIVTKKGNLARAYR